MATTQNTYTGDGSTTTFSFTFPYLETTDIKVSLNAVDTTAYTLSNATTISFTTAPTSGAAIRIYRNTDTDNLKANFFPGSAIKASDLNNNFTQNLYVTQEADFDVDTANTTANTAKTTADTAIATANTALTNSSAAVSTANTADTNASAAVTTANTANATANTAATNASNAVTTANTASTNASAAVTTANAADANATTALNNSRESDGSGGFNTAIDKANAAVTTANSASTSATAAVSTANTASTNASNAVTTANAASAAVSNAVAYTLTANVAAIPGSPSNNDYIEVTDSTGIESFTPLSGVPSGYVGASGLTARLRYDSSASSWVWLNYFANDSEDRYLTKSLPVVVGDATNGSGQITLNCENNSHGVKIKGPPHSAAASYTLTLPNDTGTSGQFLQTDGNGVTDWGDVDLSKIESNDTNVHCVDGAINSYGYINLTTNGGVRIRVNNSYTDFYNVIVNRDHQEVREEKELRFLPGINPGNHIGFKSPASISASQIWTLPSGDGTSGQAIVTNGSGVLSFADAGAPTIDGGNFDTGGSLVTTSNTIDGGSFD